MPNKFGAILRGARALGIAVILPAVATAATAAVARAQGAIEGVVRSAHDNTPIPGVAVVVEGTRLGALSDVDGRFHIAEVPAGTQTVVARRLGLDSLKKQVEVRDGATSSVELSLRESAAVLEPVVVSATREAERRSESSVTIDVLGADQIRDAHASHPAQLLDRLPGVHVSELSGEGHSMAIRQPITTKPMYLYLEDGVPTRATGFFNHNALYEVNLPQAGGVEILKGPGTALYGSDAIAGVVNVLTEPPPAAPEAKLSLEGGNYGYERLLATAGTPFSDGGIRADLNLTRSQGWRDGSDYDRQSATIRWDHEGASGPTAHTVLTGTHVNQHDVYTLDQTDYDAESPLNRSPIAFRKVDALRFSSALEWGSGSSTISLTPYARYDVLQLIPYWQLTYDPQIWDTKNYSAGLLAKYRRDFEPLHARFIGGVDMDYSPGSFTADQIITSTQGPEQIWGSYQTGARQYDYDVTYRSLSPYVHAEINPTSRLKVNGGLRLDLAGYVYDTKIAPNEAADEQHRVPPSTTVSYTHLSPKVGATFDINTAASLYASYRHGFRAPSQGQLFQQGSADNTVDLKPVTVDSYEIGVRGQGWGKLVYQLSAYDMTIHDDIITYVRPDNQRVATNAGKTRHKGIEASVGAQLVPQLRVDASYSIAHQEYVRWSPSSTVSYDGKLIDVAPRDLANVLLTWSPGFMHDGKLALEWNHTGRYAADPANTHYYPGHELFNVHANYYVAPSIQLFARAINLTDRRYAEIATYTAFQGMQYNPGAPRTIYAGVSYDWQRSGQR
ncbi:MAG TPA: TonB-dependent receptor [Gemmatimonadaceae bacterium]|nr:TonB-dependent receptor [Gemmatimonadaceae bacterium]